jgi:hypothetical protein
METIDKPKKKTIDKAFFFILKWVAKSRLVIENLPSVE